MNCYRTILSSLLSLAIIIVAAPFAIAQTDHEKHHPQQTDTGSSMTQNPNVKDRGAMPGGMKNMGEMMNEMGKPPQKEIYPLLMQVPLSPALRNEIMQLADKRIAEGNSLVGDGMAKHADALRSKDFAAMDEATILIKRGEELIKSGYDAKAALKESDPSFTALRWFRRNMNLAPAVTETQPHGFFGLSWFHYISMLTLAAFATIVIWMYFHKMKRANALVARLAGNTSEKIVLPIASQPYTVSSAAIAEPVPAINPDIAPSKSNSWSGILYVAAIFDETPTVKTFRLIDPASGKLPFNYLPGQFITVTVILKGVPVKRSYTIASSPTLRDCCEITVKHEEHGTVSHYLHTQIYESSLLQLNGPSGKFTFTGQEAESVVLIAGGVGVTPMMSVIRYLTDRSWKGDIYFFFSCKDENNIIFKEEIFYLKKRFPNLHVCIVLNEPPVNPDETFIIGRITKEILHEHVPDIISRRVHICGPPPMMDAVKQMLVELNVPKEKVITEVFAGKLPTSKTVLSDANGTGTSSSEKKQSTGVVTFVKSNKTAMLTPDKTILEASEEAGVNIEYSCRVGTCGICKIKLLSGKVTMDVEDALTNDDKAQNIILACQAKATENVSVDA